MGKPVEIWCKGIYEPDITHSLLPVENIVSQAIIVHDVFHDEEVLIVIPVISK